MAISSCETVETSSLADRESKGFAESCDGALPMMSEESPGDRPGDDKMRTDPGDVDKSSGVYS